MKLDSNAIWRAKIHRFFLLEVSHVSVACYCDQQYYEIGYGGLKERYWYGETATIMENLCSCHFMQHQFPVVWHRHWTWDSHTESPATNRPILATALPETRTYFKQLEGKNI